MKYRVHYETFVDVEAESQDEAIDLASEEEYSEDLLMNIQVMEVEELRKRRRKKES